MEKAAGTIATMTKIKGRARWHGVERRQKKENPQRKLLKIKDLNTVVSAVREKVSGPQEKDSMDQKSTIQQRAGRSDKCGKKRRIIIEKVIKINLICYMIHLTIIFPQLNKEYLIAEPLEILSLQSPLNIISNNKSPH